MVLSCNFALIIAMKRSSIIILLYIIACFACNAFSCYSHIGNRYSTLLDDYTKKCDVNVNISDKYLSIDNSSNNDYFLLDTTITPANFKYIVKLANTHNNPQKSYRLSSSKNKVKNPSWGIVFNSKANGDKYIIELNCETANLYDDINTKRAMTISLIEVCNGRRNIISSKQLTDKINLYEGENTLAVTVSDNTINIFIGKNKLVNVLKCTVSNIKPGSQVGIYAGAGSCVKVNRTLLQFERSNLMQITTKWTKQMLDERFEISNNPIEGYWQYLDRETEDKWMRIGGRYTIAIIKTNQGNYDIIYCDGAQVKKNEWELGMLKGQLTPTIFDNTFNGMWIDAIFEPINEDVQISFDEGVILTIKFPVYKSQIRFSKVIK